MKKMFLMAILLVGFAAVTTAQVDGKAIGLRLGTGVEATYWHSMGDANRIEADLGINGWSGGLYAHGVYHWVKDLSSVADGLNWYFGGGVGLGIPAGGISVGIVGQVGVEYNFEFKDLPLVASLDYRPGLYLPASFNPLNVCLSIRYKF